ncbi:MAG: DNA-binding protein, partial [Bdellovibrionaceae bacterium]|nr:DNA-binding protein [Pseudobdellovibrionaceae bacterium]
SYVARKKIRAGFVVCGIGSLSAATLRLADSPEPIERSEAFEILSLSGSLGSGGVHLHLSVADAKGQMFGGHLLPGCKIRTTAEILILELLTLQFLRVEDPATGYKELLMSHEK